ncbi:isocitrate lyase/PEP mutase family protein [Sciscionella marina]|uniref:isocitrate lyase/PEP mutase family protein n=1 Tax=Sciscionella marina TaxID=508770 RepID=UPI000368CBCB|nr:isocitrate lyase/phosphoenolpyruvate mutase family protein [Sciscionella marina]
MDGKAERFARMHEERAAFVLANAWDAGSAIMLHAAGFTALGTTSGGLALHRGHRDAANLVGRAATLDNLREIVDAVPIPVSADLENGFGDRPEEVAETVALAARTGAAGGSIEDATGRAEDPLYPFGLAVERVAAAAETARAHGFVLTARAENFLQRKFGIEETIERLLAYQEAGAHVVYAPGLPDTESIAQVCAAVRVPVNVLPAGAAARCTVAELGALGASRISLGSALSRAAMTSAFRAARGILETGELALDAFPIDGLLSGGTGQPLA